MGMGQRIYSRQRGLGRKTNLSHTYSNGNIIFHMNMTNKIFTTSDNSRIMCSIWDNVLNPVGVVQIIHGIFDKISTYDKLARFLNRNGYIVFGVDKTLSKNTRTFERAASQEIDIMQYLHNKYALPIFVIGYGYGGFVAQSVLQGSKIPATAVCLIKSGRHNRWAMKVARVTMRICAWFYGRHSNVKIINLFARRHCGMIQQSPMCTYEFCESLFDGLAKLDTAIQSENPIMIISSGFEHDMPNACFSRALYDTYRNNDMTKTTFVIYPDMENKMLMEMNCGRIQGDILSFFNDTIR